MQKYRNEEAHVTRGLHPMAVKVTSQPRRKQVISLVWLYNGFGCLATGRMLGVGACFSTYELLTAFYKDGRKDNYVYVSEALTAGIVAGGVESLMSSLFELFTIRAQVSAVSRVPNSSTNLQKESVSTSVTKLLRGYNLDVKALDHSIGLLSTVDTKRSNLTGSLKEYPCICFYISSNEA
ncbi:putative mitochondrial carrier domain superfamily [Helianthus annuus]|nr:putative mitochondrial carrier domain superfamily [Helianthus annuus]